MSFPLEPFLRSPQADHVVPLLLLARSGALTGVRIIEIIPKSPAGKILRRQLRDLAAKDKVVAKAKL
jgi:acyl-CoA synthetase (AMP-forming)/AMP-acid ligase II